MAASRATHWARTRQICGVPLASSGLGCNTSRTERTTLFASLASLAHGIGLPNWRSITDGVAGLGNLGAVLEVLLIVLGKIVSVIQFLVAVHLSPSLERVLDLLLNRHVFLSLNLIALVSLANRLTSNLESLRQKLDELVELGETILQLRVVRCDLELHADTVAIHAVRVVHGAHREQVLEELAILAVVGDLDMAVHAAAQGILDHGNGGRLGAGALQEAAVAPLDLTQIVSGDAAELRIDEAHGIAGDGHVTYDNACRVGHGHRDEGVQPASDIFGDLVLAPKQIVALHHLVLRLSCHLLDDGQTRLRLDELGQGLECDHLQCLFLLIHDVVESGGRVHRLVTHERPEHFDSCPVLLRWRKLLKFGGFHAQLQLECLVGRGLLEEIVESLECLLVAHELLER
mmetsp:Transcript_23105/g.70767  ORF Transcript_23105/g.70767 Transcript_23105/m.70767 type:complete len:403 (+) Transcript_23105:672-1880(+)